MPVRWTPEQVEQHVRELRASRRQEPLQVAAALEAQGGGVLRGVAIMEGLLRSSLTAEGAAASTSESIVHGRRRTAAVSKKTLSSSSSSNPEAVSRQPNSTQSACHSQSCNPVLCQPGHQMGAAPETLSQECSEQVIQKVTHMEQAAQIDEQEAAQFAELQYAGFIERNLGRTASEDVSSQDEMDVESEPQQAEEQDHIVLGKLNRMSKALRKELSEGASLRCCRDALEAAGHSWKLLSGTLVFVHPLQYRTVMSALSCFELRPYHIVFAESLGYLLEETLARYKGSWLASSMPVQENIKNSSEVGMASESGTSDPEADERTSSGSALKTGVLESNVEDGKLVMCVQRTFVCIVHQSTNLEGHVTASADDANCNVVTNPRVAAPQRTSLWLC